MKRATEDTSDASAQAEFVSFLSAFHEECANSMQDPSFIFFNYGLAGAPDDAYAWVRPNDRRHRYHLNLVRRMLEGVDLHDKTVLDISSGRGGNCYYLLHYSRARSISGLDRCEAYVRFCSQTVSDPRLRVVCGDAIQLPFCDASFDLVVN